MTYPILQVPADAAIGDEQLGSKNKFWFLRDGKRWLFKEARPNTGEDWAEKVAAEVAGLVQIPAARVELATFSGKRGSGGDRGSPTNAGGLYGSRCARRKYRPSPRELGTHRPV